MKEEFITIKNIEPTVFLRREKEALKQLVKLRVFSPAAGKLMQVLVKVDNSACEVYIDVLPAGQSTYVLTANDLLSSVDFNDAIARGGYPIDIHNPEGNNTNSIRLKPGRSYAIPYRCLLSQDILNLIVAGRCVSATHEAAAAIRVTPIVMAIGQAAGTAAALCIAGKTEPAELSVERLRETLARQGAIV